MRRNIIGVLAVLVVVGAFLVVRLGGRHEARSTLDQTLASLPPGYTAVHGATDYDPITDTLTVHDLVLSHDGRRVAAANKMVVSGSHPQALEAVFDPAAYPDGHPAWTDRRALLGHVDVTGLELLPPQPEAAPVTFKHIVLDDLRGRPFIRPPTAANRSAADFQTDAAQALSVKSFAAEGLDFAQPGKGHMTIASETLSDYDAGRLGNFSIDSVDLSFTGPKQSVSFSLAKFSISDVDGRAALQKLAAADGLDQAARRRVALDAYGTMLLGSADVEGFALKVSPGPRVEMASEHLTTSRQSDGTNLSNGTLKGFSLSAGDSVMPASVHEMMERFGADRIVMDVAGATEANDEKHHFAFKQFDMNFHDLGTLHLTGDIDGYDRSAMRSSDKMAMMAAVMNITIDHLVLEWDDQSLTNRIIGMVAQQQNTTPEQVRAAATMPLAALSVMVPDQPDAGAQVTAFLQHPHSLRVTLNPPSPLPLGQIAALPVPQRAHALGLKIEGS